MLVGDPRQLPEIAAGGLFAGLIARQPAIELRDNRRQRERMGDAKPSASSATATPASPSHAYLDHGRITIGDDADHTKALLVADWWAARVRGEDAIMLAGRRSDVAELNVHGRVRAEARRPAHRPHPRRRRRSRSRPATR